MKILFSSHNNSTVEEIKMFNTFISMSEYHGLTIYNSLKKKMVSHSKDIISKVMHHSCPTLVVYILKFYILI